MNKVFNLYVYVKYNIFKKIFFLLKTIFVYTLYYKKQDNLGI